MGSATPGQVVLCHKKASRASHEGRVSKQFSSPASALLPALRSTSLGSFQVPIYTLPPPKLLLVMVYYHSNSNLIKRHTGCKRNNVWELLYGDQIKGNLGGQAMVRSGSPNPYKQWYFLTCFYFGGNQTHFLFL